ncbi:hypothetical protein [Alicyclobacillus kakegawensis]|uniref:hypothetical protein n=1 Tax=Alicyclobacillus kakegawensis TaxID=392012 RepID=UPI00082BA974|nr:hypothetical protein [Alicyclobacillus kakegawensis]
MSFQYWFLYRLSDGEIVERHINSAEQWESLPDGLGAIALPLDNADAEAVFNGTPGYKVQNGQLVLAPAPSQDELLQGQGREKC